MSTTAPATTTQEREDATDNPAVHVVTFALLLAAIYVAFFVLDLGIVAGIGFSIAVPSIIGSTLAAIIQRTRAD